MLISSFQTSLFLISCFFKAFNIFQLLLNEIIIMFILIVLIWLACKSEYIISCFVFLLFRSCVRFLFRTVFKIFNWILSINKFIWALFCLILAWSNHIVNIIQFVMSNHIILISLNIIYRYTLSIFFHAYLIDRIIWNIIWIIGQFLFLILSIWIVFLIMTIVFNILEVPNEIFIWLIFKRIHSLFNFFLLI